MFDIVNQSHRGFKPYSQKLTLVEICTKNKYLITLFCLKINDKKYQQK
jgi:hypothetical protein